MVIGDLIIIYDKRIESLFDTLSDAELFKYLPLLENQNPVRRSEIFAATGSTKVALTDAIKSLSNVSES
ncbi:hypothetical protein DX185_17790 [Salmonella enterica]|nr:hypothetical protein [Salmonella enterica]